MATRVTSRGTKGKKASNAGSSARLLADGHRALMACSSRTDVVAVRGKGARVWDADGNRYLDFVSGWGANSLGHCHPVVVRAVQRQAATLLNASNQVYSESQIKLARLLTRVSGYDQVFFSNSGTEANETAVKMARRYGALHKNGAYKVLALEGGFHGRTLAMIAATGQPRFQGPFEPLPGGFTVIPYLDTESMKIATDGQTCAIILEPIQGWGDASDNVRRYLQDIRAWCDAQNMLMIVDEVFTGMGRTGALFAHQHFGVRPDIVTVAKGLGGGVTVAATLGTRKVCVLRPGEHNTTYGGNALSCAAGYAALRYITGSGVIRRSRAISDLIRGQLHDMRKEFPRFIRDIRGMGLMLVLELTGPYGDALLGRCRRNGLLLSSIAPATVRLLPPLIVSEKEAKEAIAILHDAVRQCADELEHAETSTRRS